MASRRLPGAFAGAIVINIVVHGIDLRGGLSGVNGKLVELRIPSAGIQLLVNHKA